MVPDNYSYREQWAPSIGIDAGGIAGTGRDKPAPAAARHDHGRCRWAARRAGFAVLGVAALALAGQAAANNAATGAPAVSGNPQVGQAVVAWTGGILDGDGLTDPGWRYQWMRVNADGLSNPTNIGTDSNTYTLVGADEGKKIKVRVTFTDDADNQEVLTSTAWPSGTGTILAATAAPPQVEVRKDWPLRPDDIPAGGKFRLLFATTGTRDAWPTDIATYNTFVQTEAASGHASIQPYSSGFRVVGSTTTTDARDNTATTGTEEVPIYWLGTADNQGGKIADNYGDFYDGTWHDETDPRNQSGTARSMSTNASYPFTGSDHDGTVYSNKAGISHALGTEGTARGLGILNSDLGGPLAFDHFASGHPANLRPFYALSQVFLVAVTDLTAAFEAMPGSHDGSTEFAFRVRFSEDIRNSIASMNNAFDVTGGSVVSASRVNDDKQHWEITIQPDGDDHVVIALEADRECDAGPCTMDDRRLSKRLEETVTGPLTAAFEDVPPTHDGSTEFVFYVRFSEGIRNPISTMRNKAFNVTGGSVVKASRVKGDNKYWKIVIQPDGDDDVVIVLAANRGCGSGPCTRDRRRLSERQEETVTGSASTRPEASIAANSATVAEGRSASFTVTLGEAQTKAVTVAVSITETGSMLAGTAPTSVEIAAGVTSAVLAVTTDDDKVVEDNSTVTATLSSGTGYTVGSDDSDEVVVTDNDEATFTVGAAPEEIAEGGSSTVTVSVADGVTFASDQTISLLVSGTASSSDFTLTPTTRTLTAGESSVTATVRAIDDTEAEAAETVVVTARHDGASVGSATVTIAASDVLSDDATLKTLTLSDVDIGTFSSGETSYEATVANEVSETTVTATPNDDGASVVIADADGSTAGTSRTVTLSEGENVITVTVTAEDGETKKTYTATVTREKPPLTAAFEDMPGSHDGSTQFAFHVRFSEGIRNPISTMRNKAFDVTGGSVVKARRVDGDNKYWEITIQPDGDDAVVIVLEPNRGCNSGPCTTDRRRLANRQEETVAAPSGKRLSPVVESTGIPDGYALGAAYPNPFNPEITIEFSVPRDGPVKIEVFNAAGQRLSSLVDEALRAGTYKTVWDGLDHNGMRMSSGIYFYRMQADDFVATRSMTLLK